MSASNKKKLNKEQNTARMTERQRREAEEQKKLKRYTTTFWIVMALCVCIVLSTVLTNPVKNVVYQSTTAVTIGEHKLSAVEVNYFYIDAINAFRQDYGYYLSMLMDTSKPINEQVYNKETGATWADNFLSTAIENIKSTYGLYDLAMAEGFTLPDAEKTSIDTMMSNLKVYATYNGFSNVNAYLRSVYGNGATEKSYRAYFEVCQIAAAYYDAHSESLEYDDAALRAFEADKFEQYSSYTYAYYQFKTDAFLTGGTKGSDGKVTYTDEERAAAAEIAQKLANEIAAGKYDDLDAFDKAINDLVSKQLAELKKDDTSSNNSPKTTDNENTSDENTSDKNTSDENTSDENTSDENTNDENTNDENTNDENTNDENTNDENKDEENKEEDKKPALKYTSTRMDDILYSKVNTLFIDWLIGKETSDDESKEDDKDEEEKLVVRQIGDMTVIVSETKSGDKTTINGYYVLRFGGVEDNTFKLKNVRHILVAFEGGTKDQNGKVTYSDAEKKAAKTQAEKLLAEFKATEMTEDIFAEMANKNSDDKGGRVTDGGIYKDVYPGQMVTAFNDWCFDETRKVGDFGLVETEYGWHIIYYSGESETSYRDYMLENDLRVEELQKWMDELIKSADLVEKNLKYVNRSLIMGKY